MHAHILVVDDDPILAGFLQLTLELEGFTVSVASDGSEGLHLMASERFDLLILDLVMPKIDGIRFLRLLAERGAVCPPVMIVSSAIDDELPEQYRNLGVVDHARKPVEPIELVERVKRILHSHQGPTSAQAMTGNG